jgi:hypothetical protein
VKPRRATICRSTGSRPSACSILTSTEAERPRLTVRSAFRPRKNAVEAGYAYAVSLPNRAESGAHRITF